MAKTKLNVGRSERTPAKHDLMNRLIGNEIGMLRYGLGGQVRKSRFIDLTAGDAAPPGQDTLDGWRRNCSPGLLAYHGRNAFIPTRIDLYEKMPATFDLLVTNLDRYLPILGYDLVNGVWMHQNGLTTLHLHQEDGANASLAGIDRSTAVLVTHDPNHMRDWAMRTTFASEIRAQTMWLRSISTMGCNVGGLKMLPFSERKLWFDNVRHIAAALYLHHDLYVAAIEGDAAQWAYLVETSRLETHKDRIELDVEKAFKKHGFDLNCAWLRDEQAAFIAILKQLFLTKTERSAA